MWIHFRKIANFGAISKIEKYIKIKNLIKTAIYKMQLYFLKYRARCGIWSQAAGKSGIHLTKKSGADRYKSSAKSPRVKALKKDC